MKAAYAKLFGSDDVSVGKVVEYFSSVFPFFYPMIYYSYKRATASSSLLDQDLYFQCTKDYKNREVQKFKDSGMKNPIQEMNHLVAHFGSKIVNVDGT